MKTVKKWPKELQEFYDALPPASQNNSRSIVRSDFNWALSKNPITAAQILNGKYGFGLDPDRTANDYGGEPKYNKHEE